MSTQTTRGGAARAPAARRGVGSGRRNRTPVPALTPIATGPAAHSSLGPSAPGSGVRPPRELLIWLRMQGENSRRHVQALRPFTREEFGAGPEAPTEGHVQGANELVAMLTARLQERSRRLGGAVTAATNVPSTARLQHVVRLKQSAHQAALTAERIWDFYFELFGQRQSQFGTWLLACDRIALDCYQYAYLGIGSSRSIPAPPAYSYMRTGFSPATFRRGVPLRRLGRQLNPFPLIQLPYHRMVNPWTLGAILHEVSHNLQNDLGLARAVPVEIGRQLLDHGVPERAAAIWVRWNRETFADLAGLLLGGPAVVGSLIDVVGRSPEFVAQFVPGGPHPTPWLRVPISIELLRRMGFDHEANAYEQTWRRTYPRPAGGSIPADLLRTFPDAHRIVVRAVCHTPYPSLGARTLAQSLRFESKEQQMIEEAARRLAQGNDPGVVPERFLIGAARFAVDRRLAAPEVVASNFYRELARR